MSDIVERLRREGNSCRDVCNALGTANVMQDAADEIERLRIEVTRYRKGLREICDYLKQEPKP